MTMFDMWQIWCDVCYEAKIPPNTLGYAPYLADLFRSLIEG